MRTDSLAQYSVFDYIGNEDIGDLKRLNICLEEIPYKHLIKVLDNERGYGRNDYPNLTMFFILIAMLLFEQQVNYEHMRRTLSGNPNLRTLVGLNDEDLRTKQMPNIPSEDVFTHFVSRLEDHIDLLDEIFTQQREVLFENVDEFGQYTAGDGKYFDSYAPNVHSSHLAADCRGERDATYSIKKYVTFSPKGEKFTKKETHYGFRKHTLVDCWTQLPIASKLTPANTSEQEVIQELIAELPRKYIDRLIGCSLDRGYDATDLIVFLKELDIYPLIDKRILKDLKKLTRYRSTDFYYNDKGEVFFFDRENVETIRRAEEEASNAATESLTESIASAFAGKKTVEDLIDDIHDALEQAALESEQVAGSVTSTTETDQETEETNDKPIVKTESPFKKRRNNELKKEVNLNNLDEKYKFYLASYKGYDKSTGFLKYHFKSHYVSISIKENERIFLPIARNSKKFKRLYNTRTGAERYHSILDGSLGFKHHTIRGYKKMNVFTKLADIVCLAMGIAHLKRGEDNYASIFDFKLINYK